MTRCHTQPVRSFPRGLRTEQAAAYANRRRMRGERGRRLLRQRGEKLERWKQHLYDRGGMRRVHLRGTCDRAPRYRKRGYRIAK
jgi:hypothetical protein